MENTAAGATLTPPEARNKPFVVALVGNPNCGKTTLFNALTGLRQKVGNFPGVTVEKKEGRLVLPGGGTAVLLDLPGLYSLTPHSPDEVIAREVLLGLRGDTPRPDLILNVVDASNLERNLYLTSQLLDIGLPTAVVLTMTDEVERAGAAVEPARLAEAIGIPVFAVAARKGTGLDALLAGLVEARRSEPPAPAWALPAGVQAELRPLLETVARERELGEREAFAESVNLLMHDHEATPLSGVPAPVLSAAEDARERLARREIDFSTQVIEARYDWIARVSEGVAGVHEHRRHDPPNANERVDRIVMHPVFGYVLFFFVMAVLFQSIFTWAQVPMGWVEEGVNAVARFVGSRMAEGDLRSLITEGILGGVGSTIVFLPQILLLFFFVSLMEDTGYMARAAFLMDRLMSRVGLHGKSFITLLSSFACAIPGIMATRTIGDRKARLITILVAPLMSCSARLPVYALMIGAFIPNKPVISIGGFTLLGLPGLTLLAMYLLGMVAAFGVAWLFHRTLLKGVSPTFMMELPPYRLPSLRSAFMQMVERSSLFLKRAGTLILAISIVLWFLATYPKRPDLPEEQRTAHSYVGIAGRAIEPAIAPLGFDWKIGVGLVSSFAAREVFVTAMGTVYNVDAEAEGGDVSLEKRIQEEVNPRTGQRVFTPLVAVCVMVFYVLAMQCMSTLAVVRRETNGWKWPAFQFAYMTALAWGVTFVVYQVGRAMGWG
jgi:ferrous iron transport protein B